MNERLWSPQMRKWVRDAERHGHPIGLYKARPNRRDGAGDGYGAGLPNTYRLADDSGPRVLDAPGGQYDGYRRIDHPVL
jgi:hypothetical protein